jgi:uncharacterized RDD family membrane protein YckC
MAAAAMVAKTQVMETLQNMSVKKIRKIRLAGLWPRYAAYTLDMTILSIPLYFFLGSASGGVAQCHDLIATCEKYYGGEIVRQLIGGGLIYIVLAALYFPLMECSRMQGTIGKHLVGIRVSDLLGRRVSIKQAYIRYGASILNWVTLGALSYMIMLRADKRGAHDLIAETHVEAEPPSFRGRAWMAIAALLHVVFIVAMAVAMANAITEIMKGASLPLGQ